MRLALPAAALLTAALVAGCGTSGSAASGHLAGAPDAAGTPRTGVDATSQPGVQIRPEVVSHDTPAENKAATRREAARLLALAPLPPGASRIPAPKSARNSGPPLGTPGTTSLIERARYWTVAVPLAAAYADIKDELPRGLTQSESGSGGSIVGGITSEGIGWSEPDTTYAEELELEVGMTREGPHRTLIRADGQGEWIDPRPIRDRAPGKRLRVTVADGCPSTDSGVVGVVSPGSGLDDRLVPSAAPTAGLICEFDGGNTQPASGLHQQIKLDASDARTVANQAVHLSLSHTDGGSVSCPADFGSDDVVALSYPGRPDVDLYYKASGCRSVANGHVIATFGSLSLDHWIRPVD